MIFLVVLCVCLLIVVLFQRFSIAALKRTVANAEGLICSSSSKESYYIRKNEDAAAKIREVEKGHKAVSEIVKKQAAAYANLKNESETLREELIRERNKHNATVRDANQIIDDLKEKNTALLNQGQTIKDELDLANDKLERIRGEFYGDLPELQES